ncbi:Hypothetical predicted protein [Mytilus galloprovincialis]|uniref:Uncharacterized protein n=1 Tax=Mytilus galloprovincialis TaxID=29158 RepID=A0A8B6EY30_MYTGA|nr:Hypothetical predicted protein [Mytilus galloprovincialis]
MTNHTFGCGGKIENAVSGILYRANATLLFDGNEFHLIDNSMHQIKDSTNGPTIKEQNNKIDNSKDNSPINMEMEVDITVS